MAITCIVYIALLRVIGMDDKIELIQFLILTPMLISAFCIDYKMQIIPNRLTLTMLEVGIAFSFFRGINNLNIAVEMWLGMALGAGVFLALTLIGNLIFKKETMGFGDVKLMGTRLRFAYRIDIGTTILLKLANGNSATSPTLNINSTGAKNIIGSGSCKPSQFS